MRVRGEELEGNLTWADGWPDRRALDFGFVAASALGLLVAVVLPQTSRAGTVYTTRAAYDLAVAPAVLVWSEDFESFPDGIVSLPTVIGGGSAETAKPDFAQIAPSGSTLPPSGLKEWACLVPESDETIRGVGDTSLGVNAIGFDYFSVAAGNYNFHHSGGVDSDTEMPGFTPLFVGWVGAPGEVLDFVDYTPFGAHILDDFVAHAVVEPVPALGLWPRALLLLLLTGTAASGLVLRRYFGARSTSA